ncbi:hypothetical protein [Mesorhizobium sp. B4-1-3]|uniref:hypothetical protein n=1 Tax=Mesorhizobium sp. B4-1-3 TaxID=2589889 RepID=UPI0015E30D86|nr:hypothetical protein [Mesorhizobium sp. B4-1-3]
MPAQVAPVIRNDGLVEAAWPKLHSFRTGIAVKWLGEPLRIVALADVSFGI